MLIRMAEMNWQLYCLTVLILICRTSAINDFPRLDNIQTKTPVHTQEEAVSGLIKRLIPARAGDFMVKVDPSIGPKNKDTFLLLSTGPKISITATSGVAAAWGFYYYLSQYCDCHISWAGDQVSLPSRLPQIPAPGVKVTSNDRFRYYQNVCTVSYSFAFWDWRRWEREIDWMAMNGINLPLAFNAQEAVWRAVYLAMGFTQQELDRHFGGPAFLAWARMGNIRGWGGPLPTSWHTQQVALQHAILARMRQFGMTPVLPAFAGHVPHALPKHYPNATVSKLAPWPGHHFVSSYTETLLLDSQDPLFPVIGKAFITEYTKQFGTDHLYNTDTFNEMRPKSSSPEYLAGVSRAVYKAMLAGDPEAVWVMQGWLFIDTSFWQKPQVEALLTSVPKGHMIILDLFSEVHSFYDKFESYFGQPFIWCMLHNFGGVLAMYGVVDVVNKGPISGRAFPNSTMVGTGLTPEGINQNNVIYEFMLENAWRTQPRDVNKWAVNYAMRRYGRHNQDTEQAWKIFMAGIYNCTTGYGDHGAGEVIVVSRPRLDHPIVQNVWFKESDFLQGWDSMIKASYNITDSELFRYDLVDVTRESLQLLAIPLYNQVVSGYRQRNLRQVSVAGAALVSLLSDMELVLATDNHFLLGRWIESAKALATTQTQRDLYEYNARIQVTMWGPNAEILDYANKQWSGLVQSYYRNRWLLFISEVEKSLYSGGKFNQSQFNIDVFNKVEKPFTLSKNVYPTKPIGDQIKVAQAIHARYRST